MAEAMSSRVRRSTSPRGEQQTQPPPKSKTFAVASLNANSLGGCRVLAEFTREAVFEQSYFALLFVQALVVNAV